MHLSTVEIANFRSLKNLKAEFEAGLNVLVGRNNTGKTGLLQAIRHALGPSASRGDALWLERDDFYRESAKDKTARTISITLTFTGLSEEQRAHFYEIVDFHLADPSKSKAVIRFEASWPSDKRQASIRRTGGPLTAESPEVPARILESLPVTFLPALRDAEASLAPGYRSRLAVLLRDIAVRRGGDTKTEIEAIYKRANEELENQPLVRGTKQSLQSTTRDLAGSDYSASAIRAAEVEFEKILRTLQVQMEGTPIGGLDMNGLGYNNLLYIAVVLEHLKGPDPDESPLLLIEEPEAHLHPQLTMLLADYLANKTPGKSKPPQTIVTTHSPTLAASVPPNRVHVLFTDPVAHELRCNSLAKSGMDETEHDQIQRMMDITRATLYFAKATILVEGISEALLVPVLANRLGHDLTKLHISVIPICGVAFETFKKLLDPIALGIPIAIVTDSNPPVPTGPAWQDSIPESDNDGFKLSDRTQKLVGLFEGHPTIRVFCSKLTLKYNLAEAGDENAAVMAEVWENCFRRTPGTFNKKLVAAAGTDCRAKALSAWRGICRAEHSGSKAEFAHRLASHLNSRDGAKEFTYAFDVPEYLKLAIEYIVDSVKPLAPPPEALPYEDVADA